MFLDLEQDEVSLAKSTSAQKSFVVERSQPVSFQDSLETGGRVGLFHWMAATAYGTEVVGMPRRPDDRNFAITSLICAAPAFWLLHGYAPES